MVDPSPADGRRVGYLKKKAGKGPHGFKQWKKRFVSLEGSTLSWADSPSGKEKGHVSIDALWMVRLTDPSVGRFELGEDTDILAFEAADGAEAREWVELLLQARAHRTSRWEDRMLAKVGASAGDRERLRQVAETWHDGHLTLVRDRASDADKAAADKAPAAGADALVVGGVRLWSVLHRGTLWLSQSERTASQPVGYLALDAVESIGSVPGARALTLVSARADKVTLSTDTRRLVLDWNLKVTAVHSALRHLYRAEVLRRMETAKGREPGPPEAGPAWPPPATSAAAQAAHFAARSALFAARGGAGGGPLVGPDGRLLAPAAAGLGGRLHGGAKSFDDLASLRSGYGGGGGAGGLELGARGWGGSETGSDTASQSGRSARGGPALGPYLGADGLQRADALPEDALAEDGADGAAGAPRYGDDDDEWAAAVAASHKRPEGGSAMMWWVCVRLPGVVTYYACRCLVPKPVRARIRRAYRAAEDSAAAARLRATHQAAELALQIQAELEGDERGTGPMLAGPLAPSDAHARVVPVTALRSEAAELHIGSVRDGAGRHVKFRAWLIVCGVRIPVSNRWAKRVLGARVSADKERELWAYARNLARLGLAHTRATGQGGAGAGGGSARAGRSRLAAAAAARSMPLPTADGGGGNGGGGAARAGPAVSLPHFLNLCHALPLVPPSGKFFNLDVLAAEAFEGADEPPADGEEGGAGGGAGGAGGGAGGVASGGGSGTFAVPADSFVAPLLSCREPAASKDAFFKQVPALQQALQQVHRPLAAELDDAEAARLAAQVLKAWQAVLLAGGGPSSGPPALATQRSTGGPPALTTQRSTGGPPALTTTGRLVGYR